MKNDDTAIREPDQIRQDCAKKLKAVQISDHFRAILGAFNCGSRHREDVSTLFRDSKR